MGAYVFYTGSMIVFAILALIQLSGFVRHARRVAQLVKYQHIDSTALHKNYDDACNRAATMAVGGTLCLLAALLAYKLSQVVV